MRACTRTRVQWDFLYDIPNIYGKIIQMFQTTNQYISHGYPHEYPKYFTTHFHWLNPTRDHSQASIPIILQSFCRDFFEDLPTLINPLVNVYITTGNHHFLMGKSTISMENHHFFMGKSAISMGHGFKFASCQRHYQAGSTFQAKLVIFLVIWQSFMVSHHVYLVANYPRLVSGL